MEILYGIALLIVFIIGVSTGVLIPYFIKKYITQINNEIDNKKMEEEKEQTGKPTSLTQDIIDEWQNGGVDDE